MRLRKKIEPDPEHPRFIRTMRNEGYIFVPGRRAEAHGRPAATSPGAARAGRLPASLTLAALGGCVREPEQPALRIGTNVWIGSEPLYLARELGKLDPARCSSSSTRRRARCCAPSATRRSTAW